MSRSMRDVSSRTGSGRTSSARTVRWSSLGVLLLTAVALWALFSSDSEESHKKELRLKSPSGVAFRADVEEATPSNAKATSPTSSVRSTEESSVPWISEGAKELDQVHEDSEKMEVALKSKAKRLNAQQVKQLAETAKSPKHPVRDRIFSAYMLVEGRSLTQSALADLAKAPLPDGLASTPHSEDEVRSGQERALRVMAIDALFEQAKLSEKARYEFRDLVAALKDSTLRAYGERRLAEISGLVR